MRKTNCKNTKILDCSPFINDLFQALNEKFSGDLSPTSHRSFPDEYFTCRTLCTSCDERCVLQLNHGEAYVKSVASLACELWVLFSTHIFEEKYDDSIG